MNRVVNYLVYLFLFFFILVSSVNAECSYQERKDLLNEAKNVEAFFDVNTVVNRFDFYLYGLSDKIFVTIEDTSNGEIKKIYNYQLIKDYYTFSTNVIDKVVNYKITYYSNLNNCYGDKIFSKNIKKGIINKFSKESVCKGYEEYYYCNLVLDNTLNLTDSEVYKKIYDYKKSLNGIDTTKESNKYIEFIKNKWYLIFIIPFSIIIILIIRLITKKRGELV